MMRRLSDYASRRTNSVDSREATVDTRSRNQEPCTRRRAESDYLNAERFASVNKLVGSGHEQRPRFRTSSLSLLSRARTASGSYQGRLDHGRSGSRRDTIVHAVDLKVFESMSTPSTGSIDESEKLNHAEAVVEEKDQQGCLICMGRFTKKRPSINIPCIKACNLAPVHAKCIYEWKDQKRGAGTCPLCRSELGHIDYSPPDMLHLSSLHLPNVHRKFCTSPIPKGGGTVRCYVKARNGFWGSPVRYEMFVQAPTTLRYPLGPLPSEDCPQPGDQLLMTAVRRLTKWGTSTIDINLSSTDSSWQGTFLGSMCSNFSGLEHTLVAPYTSVAHGSNSNGHRELAAVVFTQNRIGSASGPRRMQVCLPTVIADCTSDDGQVETKSSVEHIAIQDINVDHLSDSEDEEEAMLSKSYLTALHRPKTKSDQLVSWIRKKDNVEAAGKQLYFGQNKEPYWLDAIQAYSLDFQGRVTLPSNKNFQLELSNMPECITMQFGKVVASMEGSPVSVYTVDLQWPLSPLQAFGIALSACDRKIAVA